MLYQLKIQIKGITQPPVWRKVLVPASFTMHKLHTVIQAAFGWEDYHIYQFSPKGFGSRPIFEEPNDVGWEKEESYNSKSYKVGQVLSEHPKLIYTYDFGDNWEHQVTVEKIISELTKKAQLLTGKGNCPPEDCGGIYGYANLKEALSNPDHEEFEEIREWLGLEDDEYWDIKYFDIEEHQKAVASI